MVVHFIHTVINLSRAHPLVQQHGHQQRMCRPPAGGHSAPTAACGRSTEGMCVQGHQPPSMDALRSIHADTNQGWHCLHKTADMRLWCGRKPPKTY